MTSTVKASIHTINDFSAHAGKSELLGWHARTGQPDVTFLVHGEEKPMEAMAHALAPARVEMPGPGQRFAI